MNTTGEPVRTAQRLADEVLFPAALETDAADVVPREHLDLLAEAGFYGLSGPAWAGGMDADLPTMAAVIETLASGCLSTAFVWTQHLTTAFVAGACESPPIRKWVRPLCRGEIRAGLALAGALPGPQPLRAVRTDGGWLLDGASPWVSGWGLVDVLHTAALTEDGTVVWSFVEACEGPDLHAERVALVALNATATVTARFRETFVPDDRVTMIVPPGDPSAPPASTLRKHAALALGVATRCGTLLGPSPLDEERSACRDRLDAADAAAMPAARAAASDLALRSAAALMNTVGSRSLRLDEHPQRLAREALFASVFAGRPPVREATLELLGAALPRSG